MCQNILLFVQLVVWKRFHQNEERPQYVNEVCWKLKTLAYNFDYTYMALSLSLSLSLSLNGEEIILFFFFFIIGFGRLYIVFLGVVCKYLTYFQIFFHARKKKWFSLKILETDLSLPNKSKCCWRKFNLWNRLSPFVLWLIK